MKVKLLGRTIEFNNNWVHISNFSEEKILIGRSFNLKKSHLSDIKDMFLYAFMPYNWLNDKFMKNKIK